MFTCFLLECCISQCYSIAVVIFAHVVCVTERKSARISNVLLGTAEENGKSEHVTLTV